MINPWCAEFLIGLETECIGSQHMPKPIKHGGNITSLPDMGLGTMPVGDILMLLLGCTSFGLV